MRARRGCLARVAWAAAVATCAAVTGSAVEAGAAPVSLEPAIWAADAFSGSTRGFLGCVQTDASSVKYCFVAHHVTRTDGSPATRIVTQVFVPPAPNGLPNVNKPIIIEDTAAEDALTVLPPLPGQPLPRLALRAQVTTVGDVDIVVRTIGDSRVRARGNEACTGYPISFELAGENAPEIASFVWGVTGEIGGATASSWGGACSAYFFGRTAGVWMMPSGTF